jgi:cytochrome c oxidase subunit 2
MSPVPFFPDSASTLAPQVDAILFFLLALTAFFSILIAGLIVFFAVRYRYTDKTVEREGKESSHLLLELAWTAIPTGIVMVIFFWSAIVMYHIKTIPGDAVELFVVGRQWMWKIQHPEGQREINALHVPVGVPIQLTMISEDVIHSFYIPAFRIKQDVLPGRYSKQWFQATKPGTYHIFCAEYCGTMHSRMIGQVIAMAPKDYQRWLSGDTGGTGSMSSDGSELFKKMGCATCHLDTGEGRGPTLRGVFGKKVALESGQTVMADEAYLRESILRPGAKLVRGYQQIMPTFQNQLTEQNVLELIAYIKTLGTAKGTAEAQ